MQGVYLGTYPFRTNIVNPHYLAIGASGPARASASKSEYLFEVVDAQAAFPTSRLEREIVMLLAQNS